VSSGAGVDITWSDGHASHYARRVSPENVPVQCATMSGGKKKRSEKTMRAEKENPTERLRCRADRALSHVQAQISAQGRACRRETTLAD